MRARLTIRYILGEMIPTFFLGVIIFVLILLMFQALRLTDFVLIHGVKLSTIGLMVTYLSTSFLPVLFPMSLLFTVLMTYTRLSSDSEIVAFKAAGLSMWHIISPAAILGILVFILSAQMGFYIAPTGNRRFEVLVTKVGSMRPGVTLKEGTFSEGFFDLVVYANKVDSKQGRLQQVFIYDERDEQNPITVIAKEGRLVTDPDMPGHKASLRLSDGSIHRTTQERHTKIDFSTYTIFLSDPLTEAFRKKSPQSLTLDELRETIAKGPVETDEPDEFMRIKTELHKRWAIAFACVLFALIGVGLGTTTNKRAVKSGSMVICLGLIIVYWVIYVASESLARSGKLPPGLAMWLANIIFGGASIWTLKRAWN